MSGERPERRHIACRALVTTLLAILFLAAGSLLSPVAAAGPPKTMDVGRSELLEFQGIERLAVSDPSTIDYVVLSKNQIMLVAKKPGAGDLIVWDKSGRQTFHITVAAPPSRMPEVVAKITTALNRPAITVSDYNEIIILEGEVDNAEEVKRAEVIASAYTNKVENLLRVAGAPAATPPDAAAEPPVAKSLQVGASLQIGFSGISKVTVSDPAVLDTVELSKIQLMLVGKTAGTANLYVWDKHGPHAFTVVVTSRMPQIVEQIKQAIARPTVTVSEHNGTVLLEGTVDNAAEVKRAEVIARAYATNISTLLRPRALNDRLLLNLDEIRRVMGTGIRVSEVAEGVLLFEGVATPAERTRLDTIIRALGDRVAVIDMVTSSAALPRQVLVQVRAVEINRSALRELGVLWGSEVAPGVIDPGTVVVGEEDTGPVSLDEFGPIRRLDNITARLKALITSRQARILAEPNLVVQEGQLAQILVGGEFPVPVVQTVGVGVGSVSVEWKEFGVKLAIKPVINPDGESVYLDVAPEVSSLDFTNAVVVSNLSLPSLQTRRAHSVLNIRSGQTLIIGGLYQTEQSKLKRKIPLLGDIPLLGQLFQRTDRLSQETELIVFVTPVILTEAAAAARTEAAQQRMGVNTDGGITAQPR